MEKYCKYCGKELVRHKCDCSRFNSNKTKKVAKLVCDSCGKKIEDDSEFCKYCGMPIGNIVLSDDEMLKNNNVIDIFFENGDNNKKLKIDEKDNIKNDNIVKKRESSEPHSIVSKIIINICYIVLIALVVILMVYLYPKIKRIIFDYNFKNNNSIIVEGNETTDDNGEIVVLEDTTFALRYVNEWVRRDGHFYCFDENGNPVVDDWVKEVDEDGNVSWFYFDEKGQLVTDSWIEGLYYVGIDGKLLTNSVTPDGERVDENGRVIIENEEIVMTEDNTYIFYDSPDSVMPKETSNQKSASSGSIKGKINMNADLYLSSLNEYKEKIKINSNSCMLHYYYPIIKGKNAVEVNAINDKIKNVCNKGEFYTALQKKAKEDNLKSILLNKVSEHQVNETKYRFSIYGTITYQNGIKKDLKYTFIYNRKNGILEFIINTM